jgi:hypothetical protein
MITASCLYLFGPTLEFADSCRVEKRFVPAVRF